MPRKAKLVLPTVETCRWRSVQGDNVQCGLVSSMLGPAASRVTEQICRACCDSFPPCERKLNPVVASVLFREAGAIEAAGGTSECRLEVAHSVRQRASGSVNIVHPTAFRLTPARVSQSCCWKGNTKLSAKSVSTNGRSNSATDPKDLETLYECNHPNHQYASESRCRMCRDWLKQPPISRMLSLEELVPRPKKRCGPKVRKWGVGVTTAPRRDPTLELTLDSLVRAGWDDIRLFLDGTLAPPKRYEHLPVTWREDSVGAWPAWYMALAELILHQPDADAYLILQDDAILHDRHSLREYLETVLWPGTRPGIISLFYSGTRTENGWFNAHGSWSFSATALLISPGTARALLCDSELSHAWLAAAGGNHIPVPEMLAGWSRANHIEVWSTSPSLSQHVGNTSTIWMNAGLRAGRRAAWFSGSVESELGCEESLTDFPEDIFPVDESRQPEYQERIERGRQRMAECSVVVCGLSRDVRQYLPRTATRIERLGEMFADYRVSLFENDSTDATVEFLSDWCHRNSRVEYLSTTKGHRKYERSRSLERAKWLAFCRNQYRELIQRKYSKFDYVIVVDTDLAGGWSYDGIAHTFGHDQWDYVGSYGLDRRLDRKPGRPPFFHFDTWAYRPAIGILEQTLEHPRDLDLPRGGPLLPVESCFGGVGIYRMECMLAAEYAGGDCEHVIFHNRLRHAGFSRQFFNPSQLVLYSPLS